MCCNGLRTLGGAASRGTSVENAYGTCGDESNMFQQKRDPLLSVYEAIFHHGTVPRSWCCTLFNTLPEKVRPTQVADFHQ